MPSSGDNLSIDALGTATGQSIKSLGNAAGSTSTPINVSDFTITGVTTPTTDSATYPYNYNATIQANFTGAGSRFLSRIGSTASNFTWPASISGMTLITNEGYRRVYTNLYNPGGTGCSTSTTRTVTITFMDTFNTPATNYNTALTTASFTLYSPPKPSVSSWSSTPPPRACDTGSGCGSLCYGADLTVNAAYGSYAGVNGSSLNYYLNGTLRYTGATSWYSGRIFCGSTSYTLYVRNNFNCQSDSVNITTAAYV